MRGMQEGGDGGISGIPSDDTAWTGEGGTLELGRIGQVTAWTPKPVGYYGHTGVK